MTAMALETIFSLFSKNESRLICFLLIVFVLFFFSLFVLSHSGTRGAQLVTQHGSWKYTNILQQWRFTNCLNSMQHIRLEWQAWRILDGTHRKCNESKNLRLHKLL
jgi:hypothetical protein